MLNSFPAGLLAGILLGFLAGLGVGGGTLLILWLTLVIGLDGNAAGTVNLLFFLAAAGTVTLLRWKKGALDLKAILPGVLAGVGFAILGSLLGRWIDPKISKTLFGIVLLATGLRELFYRPQKAK